MSENLDVENEAKKWNWGAFFLTPFWCIRHGVKYGFFLLVPFFNFFVPFILGAQGSKKARLKNPNENLEIFLKRQKFWSRAGFIFILALATTFLYSLNYSRGVRMTLDAVNSNMTLAEYLGQPIKKSSLFTGETSYLHNKNELPKRKVGFNVVGPKGKGHIDCIWKKRDSEWIITKLHFKDVEGVTHKLIENQSLFSDEFELSSSEDELF